MKDFGIFYFKQSTKEFLGWVSTKPPNGVLLDTLRLQGMVTLEWSKILMLRLHYGGFKKHFGSAVVPNLTDTDSLIQHITITPEVVEKFGLDPECLDEVEVEHLLAKINDIEPMFDLTKAGYNTYKGRVGFAKLEVGTEKRKSDGKLVTQYLIAYAGAQSKMYALYFAEVEQVNGEEVQGEDACQGDSRRSPEEELRLGGLRKGHLRS